MLVKISYLYKVINNYSKTFFSAILYLLIGTFAIKRYYIAVSVVAMTERHYINFRCDQLIINAIK